MKVSTGPCELQELWPTQDFALAISVHSMGIVPSLRQAYCLLLANTFSSVNVTNQTFFMLCVFWFSYLSLFFVPSLSPRLYTSVPVPTSLFPSIWSPSLSPCFSPCLTPCPYVPVPFHLFMPWPLSMSFCPCV